jgi:hypothetical protein
MAEGVARSAFDFLAADSVTSSSPVSINQLLASRGVDFGIIPVELWRFAGLDCWRGTGMGRYSASSPALAWKFSCQ